MAFNFCQLFILFGLLQGVICIVILLGFRPVKSQSNLYLSLLIFSFIGNVGQYWLQDTGIISYNEMQLLFLPWQMLIAPLFYLYVTSLRIFDHNAFKKWILFLPLIIMLTVHLIIKTSIVQQGIEEWIQADWVSLFYLTEELLSLLYCLIITMVVYRLIKKERARANYHGFGVNRKIVGWIRSMLQIGLGLAIIWMISLYIGNHTKDFESYYVLWSAMVIVLNILGIVGIYYTYLSGGFTEFDLLVKSNSGNENLDETKIKVSTPQKYLRQDLLNSIITLSSSLGSSNNIETLQNDVKEWFFEEFGIKEMDFGSKNTKILGVNKNNHVLQIPFASDIRNQNLATMQLSNDIEVNEADLYYFNMVLKTYDFHRERIKTRKTPSKIDKSNRIYKSLIALFDDEEPYTDPNLDLNSLSQKLDVSPGYLSKVINDSAGKSYTDFVTEYRILKVKNLMRNPEFEHYNILGFGLEAGFNSKSTFYKAFQNAEGMSPGKYLEQLKNSRQTR